MAESEISMTRLKLGLSQLDALRERRDFDAFEQAAEALTLEFPDEPEVAYARARYHADAKELEAALDQISRAVGLAPEKTYYRHMRALYLLRSGRFAEALSSIREVIEREREAGRVGFAGEAAIFAAWAHAQLGQPGEVLAALENAKDDDRTWIRGLVSVSELRARARADLARHER